MQLNQDGTLKDKTLMLLLLLLHVLCCTLQFV